MARLFRSLTVLVFVTGCFFPADRGHLLEARVDKLADDNQKLRDQLKETQTKLDDTGAQLKTALEQLDAASRSTGANMGVKLDSAIQDVATLRGSMESYQYKLTELEQKLAQSATTTPPIDGKKEEPKKEEPKKPDDPKEFLKLAEDKVKSGDPEAARKLFTEFLKKWPRDEAAGEAHFGLGETYFNEGMCREALYEYKRVIEDFGKTKSVPESYLRSSNCFKELKMDDAAKEALKYVIANFAKSDAAKTAKTRLAELEKAEKTDKKKKGTK